MADMIPTWDKTKIPHGWSYPVGAEIVSNALEGIPQYEKISLRFVWLNPSSRLARKDKSRLFIFRVAYTNPQHTAMERNWMIDVSAVPSELRHHIRDQLISHVLPRARSWVAGNRPASWYESEKMLEVFFNLDSEQFEYHETEAA